MKTTSFSLTPCLTLVSLSLLNVQQPLMNAVGGQILKWKSKQLSRYSLQSYFRMARVVQNEHAKRCNNAATQIQAFFRMVRAMVDCEIKEQLKRRKIRKMLKNRTKEIDDLMLEEAWVGMSTSNDSKPLRPLACC